MRQPPQMEAWGWWDRRNREGISPEGFEDRPRIQQRRSAIFTWRL